MEYHNRRSRRGRGRTRVPMPFPVSRRPKQSFFTNFYNFFIMSSLVMIVYLMLDYHCNICSKKCDIYNITRGIHDITDNITHIKSSYSDLEKTLQKISFELPRIEGQIEVLEVLANTMERGDYAWNPKTHLPLPNVDVFLNTPEKTSVKGSDFGNSTKKGPKRRKNNRD
ncbi:uncharacterized protein LOC125065859 [Vanessa atalanta]|uniref:uncharacterized protein LOC125065859 n=1 Tax=Vanessa atalanta TaxID=42275 RepID=UPI001FCDDE00|nr:uncharacterized protein LOC125065859 [Vanessa atalanta]